MTSTATKRKSSKRFAASSGSPPKHLTFYTDECLGKQVPAALVSAGYSVKPWYNHFAGVADVEWLRAIGDRRWILLTRDKNIRRRPLEVEAIINAGVRAFVLTATELRGVEQSEIFVKAMPRIVRICRHRGPFVFN